MYIQFFSCLAINFQYLFIVNLQHTKHHLELHLRAVLLLYSLEQVLASDGNYAFVGSIAHHGVGLATACLPVGKQGAVVALPGIVQHSLAKVIEYTLL